MGEPDRLLRAVLIDPSDDLARLAWADSLEEDGQPGLAWFVRRAVRRGAGQGTDYCCAGGGWAWYGPDGQVYFSRGEASLFWLLGGVAPAEGLSVVARRGLIDEAHCRLRYWLQNGPGLCGRWPIRRLNLTDRFPDREGRGWGWRSEPTVEAWLAVSAFVDRASVPGDLIGTGSPGLFGRAFLTEADAMAALSLACVNWARGQAGLPPLATG